MIRNLDYFCIYVDDSYYQSYDSDKDYLAVVEFFWYDFTEKYIQNDVSRLTKTYFDFYENSTNKVLPRVKFYRHNK